MYIFPSSERRHVKNGQEFSRRRDHVAGFANIEVQPPPPLLKPMAMRATCRAENRHERGLPESPLGRWRISGIDTHDPQRCKEILPAVRSSAFSEQGKSGRGRVAVSPQCSIQRGAVISTGYGPSTEQIAPNREYVLSAPRRVADSNIESPVGYQSTGIARGLGALSRELRQRGIADRPDTGTNPVGELPFEIDLSRPQSIDGEHSAVCCRTFQKP